MAGVADLEWSARPAMTLIGRSGGVITDSIIRLKLRKAYTRSEVLQCSSKKRKLIRDIQY